MGLAGCPTDQHGQAVTIAGAVEANLGQRLTRENAFEGHPRRELIAIQRQVVLGDQDDPDGDIPMPDQTRRTAAALAARLGLAGPDVASRREQARAQRDRVMAARQLASGGRRHPGYGESPQERAARVSKPPVGELVRVADGVCGSLPVYRQPGDDHAEAEVSSRCSPPAAWCRPPHPCPGQDGGSERGTGELLPPHQDTSGTRGDVLQRVHEWTPRAVSRSSRGARTGRHLLGIGSPAALPRRPRRQRAEAGDGNLMTAKTAESCQDRGAGAGRGRSGPAAAPARAHAYRTSPDGFPAPLAGQVPQPAPPRSHTNGCLADYPG